MEAYVVRDSVKPLRLPLSGWSFPNETVQSKASLSLVCPLMGCTAP